MSGIGFPTLSIIDIRGDINKVIDSTMNDYYSYYFNINLAKFNSDGKMVIVYASNFNIQYGIETYNIINGAFHNRSFVITSNNITYIDFHPDGKHIIFIDNGDLWLVDLYGKNKILLLNETYDIEYPCFSNDGSKLVYVMNNQIYVTDIEFNSNNDDNHHTDNDNTILTLVYRNEFLFLIIIIIILLLILYKLKKKLKS